ncbi:MAG TPA: hypothetical protein VHM24_12600 [Gemmatimonadaceae bacterium]|nr:hypothetical protein [Gemmatimonadaceae bacterium]
MNSTKHLLSFLCVAFSIATFAAWGASSANAARAEALPDAGCLDSSDSLVIDLKDHLVTLVETSSATDFFSDTVLSVYGVARVASSQIAIVTDTTTCRRAADAYSAAIGISDPSRQVHAVKAGIRYLVIDPLYKPVPYMTGITFDSSFIQTITAFTY